MWKGTGKRRVRDTAIEWVTEMEIRETAREDGNGRSEGRGGGGGERKLGKKYEINCRKEKSNVDFWFFYFFLLEICVRPYYYCVYDATRVACGCVRMLCTLECFIIFIWIYIIYIVTRSGNKTNTNVRKTNSTYMCERVL